MADTNIYLIPGLGADKRMYAAQLKVLPRAIILEHMKPLVGEDIRAYAGRLAKQIDGSKPFVLIGTSLGGIIALEISRFLSPQKIILISSVKHRGELPLWMRSVKYLNLHKLLSGRNFIRLSNSNIRRLINKRNTEVARSLMDMHADADPYFVEWAIDQVVNWNGAPDAWPGIIHIHGTADRLFPHVNITDAILIKGGSHVMGMTQAHDVNKVLLQVL